MMKKKLIKILMFILSIVIIYSCSIKDDHDIAEDMITEEMFITESKRDILLSNEYKIAKDVLMEKTNFAKRKSDIMLVYVDNSFLKKSNIFAVGSLRSSGPCPEYSVVVDNTGKAYIFHLGKDSKIFSKIIAHENILITEENIRAYIDVLVLLLSEGMSTTKVITNMEQINNVPPSVIKKNSEILKQRIKNIEYSFKDERIEINFCTFNSFYRLLKNWNLKIKKNGEIISCEINEFANISRSKNIMEYIEWNRINGRLPSE